MGMFSIFQSRGFRAAKKLILELNWVYIEKYLFIA